MSEILVQRSGWMPRVLRGDDGALTLELAAGADANHDPREFSIPIEERHLDVLRNDLARHLVLWCALLPLCEAAGTRGDLDVEAAVGLLDPVLLGTADEVDALLRERRARTTMLVGHGADVRLLERGQVLDSLHSARENVNHQVTQAYVANRDRALRGVRLAPIDEAVLRFTGQYLHSSTRPGRNPDAVDAGLLPQVLEVVAAAERATKGLKIRRDPSRGRRASDKQDWNRMSKAVDQTLRREYPKLAPDTVRSLAFLMCSEAARHAEEHGEDDDTRPVTGGAAKTVLVFTDEDSKVDRDWRSGAGRGAASSFWDFVAERSEGGSKIFTIEDTQLDEGLQLQLYATAAARVTVDRKGRRDAKEYRVEYALIDGMDGYRAIVSEFARGGCAALDDFGPWIDNFDEVERARRRRDTGSAT